MDLKVWTEDRLEFESVASLRLLERGFAVRLRRQPPVDAAPRCAARNRPGLKAVAPPRIREGLAKPRHGHAVEWKRDRFRRRAVLVILIMFVVHSKKRSRIDRSCN